MGFFYWEDYNLIIDYWLDGYDENEISKILDMDLDYVIDCVDYYLYGV